MLDQSNWVPSDYYAGHIFFIYFDISDFISKDECDVNVYKNFTEGYVPEKLVVALTDDIYPTVDTTYRILNNNGTILNKRFDFSSWNKIYLCIGFGDGFDENPVTKQLKINELFENWKILITPTSQTLEAPIYIGENQLDSVEGVADYVDKSSGKIVRMIGEYTFTGDESFNKYGNSDVFYTRTIDPVGITTVNTTTMRCDHPAFTAIENKVTSYWLNPEADNVCCFLPGGRSQVFLRSTSNFTTATECKAYLKAQFDNGTPVKISYWLKTPVEEDPPVLLPDISTIEGETIIDYDGTPKPSQMYIKYKGKAVQ